MTARKANAALALASLAAGVLAGSACVSYHEVSVQTPIRARLDVSAFDRIFVAGFIAGGSGDVDGNLETTRLLRSQLKNQSLRVIDAEVLPLMDVAADRGAVEGVVRGISQASDFEPYKHIFANAEFWQRIGEQYEQPLIVTGTILFVPQDTSQVVTRPNDEFDELGRRTVAATQQQLVQQRGYVLQPSFIFIDGRTGAVLHQETYDEAILYPASNPTPALSSYFELMDRVLPGFLNTFSSQTIRGTRVLLR